MFFWFFKNIFYHILASFFFTPPTLYTSSSIHRPVGVHGGSYIKRAAGAPVSVSVSGLYVWKTGGWARCAAEGATSQDKIERVQRLVMRRLVWDERRQRKTAASGLEEGWLDMQDGAKNKQTRKYTCGVFWIVRQSFLVFVFFQLLS